MTAPTPCTGWTFPESCGDEWEQFGEDEKISARIAAGGIMRMMTADVYGGCEFTVRPCTRGCYASSVEWLQGAPFMDGAGNWLNTCGCSVDGLCSCELELSRVDLKLAGSIISVVIDGVAVDPSAYRLDDARWLVRTDGELWPSCQDFKVDSGPGTFLVTYFAGVPVGAYGELAGQRLALELGRQMFGKGGKCNLTANVKSIVRQGVSYELIGASFEGGITGIPLIDSYVSSVNPNHLRFAPMIISPKSTRLRGIGLRS